MPITQQPTAMLSFNRPLSLSSSYAPISQSMNDRGSPNLSFSPTISQRMDRYMPYVKGSKKEKIDGGKRRRTKRSKRRITKRRRTRRYHR